MISLDRNNQKNLDLIGTSLFAVVLDENAPETDTEVRILKMIIILVSNYSKSSRMDLIECHETKAKAKNRKVIITFQFYYSANLKLP